MYSKILVPVDLAHTDKMVKALNTSIDIAKHYNATLCYVTVTNSTPGAAAHNPKELAEIVRFVSKPSSNSPDNSRYGRFEISIENDRILKNIDYIEKY